MATTSDLSQELKRIAFLKKYVLDADVYAKINALLVVAADNDDAELFQVLLKRGADISSKYRGKGIGNDDSKEVSKLMKEHGLVVEAARSAPPRAKPSNKDFFKAIEDGNIEEVERMLDEGFDINEPDADFIKSRSTPLVKAIRLGLIRIAHMLLKRGADIYAKNKHGDDALIMAAYMGNLEMVKELLNRGADIHSKNNEGKSVLWWANLNNQNTVAKYLKSQGAK